MAKKKPSAKQLAARRKFARIMKSGGFKKHKKKLAAVKIIERGETRSTRPDRVVKVSRKPGGQFKKFKQVGGFDRITVVKQISDTVSSMNQIDKQLRDLKTRIKSVGKDKQAKTFLASEYRFVKRLRTQKEKQLSDLKRLL